MNEEIRELRLRYTVSGMTRLLTLMDAMKLGELPQEIALFITHASNAANWHPEDDPDA